MTTRIKKTTDDVQQSASDLADEAAEQLSALKDEAVKMVEARVDALGKAIQQHPLLAVGIGFGVGYLLARLLHRD